jgi:hypothetical protein
MCACGGGGNNRRQAAPPKQAATSARPIVQIKYGMTQIMAQRGVQQQQKERVFQRQIMATKQPVIQR